MSSQLIIDTVSTPRIIDAYGSSALIDPLIEDDSEALKNAPEGRILPEGRHRGCGGPCAPTTEMEGAELRAVTYTVGDVVRLEVDFTAGVSWLAEESPPPIIYRRTHWTIWGAPGLVPDNFTFAKYVSGNGTRFLRFSGRCRTRIRVHAPLPSTGVGRLGTRRARFVDAYVKLRRAFDDAFSNAAHPKSELGLLSMYLPPSSQSPLEHYYEIRVDGQSQKST